MPYLVTVNPGGPSPFSLMANTWPAGSRSALVLLVGSPRRAGVHPLHPLAQPAAAAAGAVAGRAPCSSASPTCACTAASRCSRCPEVLLFTVLTPIYVTLLDDAPGAPLQPWALVAALVAVGGGVAIRFQPLEGDYLGFPCCCSSPTPPSPPARCCAATCSPARSAALYRFFGHFFPGARWCWRCPPWLIFGARPAALYRDCSGACWCGWACSPRPSACSGGQGQHPRRRQRAGGDERAARAAGAAGEPADLEP